MGANLNANNDASKVQTLTRVELDQGLGDLILKVLLEHEGKMAAHELLTVLIRRERMSCEFAGQLFDVEFVIGEEGLPELKVYPDRGSRGWQVRLGGPKGHFFRKIYSTFGQGAVISVDKGQRIHCKKGLFFQRTATLSEINDLLGARIFDPNYQSTTLEKQDITI